MFRSRPSHKADMDDLFEWGTIVRPQGIRGEMKVDTDLDDEGFLSGIRTVTVQLADRRRTLKVLSLRRQGEAVVIGLDTVGDRNAAELLRGARLLLTRKDHPLPEDTNLISDLIGCRIIGINSQNNIGIVKSVTRFPAQDVYTYTDGQNEWMVPALKKVFPRVDVEAKTIFADETMLLQTSVMQER